MTTFNTQTMTAHIHVHREEQNREPKQGKMDFIIDLSIIVYVRVLSLSLSLSLSGGGLPLISSRSENVSHLEVSKRRLFGISMLVSGLPVAVNGVLTDLLQQQALTSWKVAGDTTATVALDWPTPAPRTTQESSAGDVLQVPLWPCLHQLQLATCQNHWAAD